MGTYFVCYNYTDQGMLSPGSSRKRFPLLKQRVVDMGGELIGFYLMMGHRRYRTFLQRRGMCALRALIYDSRLCENRYDEGVHG